MFVQERVVAGAQQDEVVEVGGSAVGPVAVSEAILMEVLAGARDERRRVDLRRLLTAFAWIKADAVADFEGAARVYRQCRSAGVTPRGLIDCMIVTVAIRSGSDLLTADRDFHQIARVVPIRLDEASAAP